MRDVYDKIVASFTPVEPNVLTQARVGSGTRAAHDMLAERVRALGEIEQLAPTRPRESSSRLRIAAWNVERLKYTDASRALLDAVNADVTLLSEVDIGMARSGNRHTVQDLVGSSGEGALIAVEFVETSLGDSRERVWHAGEVNRSGFHGNAIVSRLPLADAFVIPLDQGGYWFGEGAPQNERRLGGRMALAARIVDAAHPLWVVSVHLESSSTAAYRAAQVDHLLSVLHARIGDAACVIGGDMNTADMPDTAEETAAILHNPASREPLFVAMHDAGFGWRGANTAALTQRARPDGTPKPPYARIDWLFTRGVQPLDALTAPAIDASGAAISDHDLVLVEVDAGG